MQTDLQQLEVLHGEPTAFRQAAGASRRAAATARPRAAGAYGPRDDDPCGKEKTPDNPIMATLLGSARRLPRRHGNTHATGERFAPRAGAASGSRTRPGPGRSGGPPGPRGRSLSGPARAGGRPAPRPAVRQDAGQEPGGLP
ncbi:hypothetical protein GCM10022244_11480 [Streptomyces gulbargensis]|uniref:Uncharacterized protein n=1 Tax=Streptomyces gulbargensis TaxID=364901 RepID=A0ABP7LNC3_9ACTN